MIGDWFSFCLFFSLPQWVDPVMTIWHVSGTTGIQCYWLNTQLALLLRLDWDPATAYKGRGPSGGDALAPGQEAATGADAQDHHPLATELLPSLTQTTTSSNGWDHPQNSWKVSWDFPSGFHHSMPAGKLLTPSSLLCDQGHVCLDILEDKWSALCVWRQDHPALHAGPARRTQHQQCFEHTC